jgi:hypothetical protein
MSEEKHTPQVDQAKAASGDPRLRRPEAAAGLLRSTQIVIWIGLGLLVVALAWWAISRKLTVVPIIIGGIGALGVVFWVAYNLGALRATAGTRAAKLVLNSVGFILFVLGIVVCLNVIVSRHHPRLDLTQNKIYSLAPQSMAVLKGLTKDVDMIAFLPQDSGSPRSARDLVRLYSTLSPHIKVTWADYTDVALAKQYQVTFPGTVVVKSGEEPNVRQEKVTDVSEQRLTSAIMSVTTETKTIVYFLVGHGEASTTGGENSVSTLKSDLGNQQYEVKDLDLAKMAKPAVPGDCGVLAIIGAKQAPAPQEMEAIEKYVDNKGKLLLALAPPPGPDFASILGKRGVTVLGGVVLDPESNYLGQAQAPLVTPKPGSPIVEGVDRVVMPLARGMKVQTPSQPPAYPGAPPPPSGPASSVLDSSASAWLQTNLQAGLQRPANAQTGPFSLAATVDETPPTPPAMPGQPPPPQEGQDATRIVVIGSDLALNDTLVRSFKFNDYLALNSFAWLSKNARLISIPPKSETPHNLLLTSTQKNFIIFVVMFFIPLGVIVAGVSVWWTRRR